jgi:membrane protein implicated in regulation of membrane protease activity
MNDYVKVIFGWLAFLLVGVIVLSVFSALAPVWLQVAALVGVVVWVVHHEVRERRGKRRTEQQRQERIALLLDEGNQAVAEASGIISRAVNGTAATSGLVASGDVSDAWIGHEVALAERLSLVEPVITTHLNELRMDTYEDNASLDTVRAMWTYVLTGTRPHIRGTSPHPDCQTCGGTGAVTEDLGGGWMKGTSCTDCYWGEETP